MLEFYLVIIAVVIAAVYIFREFMSDFKKVKAKGPPTLPFTSVGLLFTLFLERGKEWICLRSVNFNFLLISDPFQIFQKLSKLYPDYYGLWFGKKYFFVTDSPPIIETLLKLPECTEKNLFMQLFGFPNGLLSLKGEF